MVLAKGVRTSHHLNRADLLCLQGRDCSREGLLMEDNAQLLDLTGKTALVTSASHGLGVTFAQALSGAGAQLVLPVRRADTLQAVS